MYFKKNPTGNYSLKLEIIAVTKQNDKQKHKLQQEKMQTGFSCHIEVCVPLWELDSTPVSTLDFFSLKKEMI